MKLSAYFSLLVASLPVTLSISFTPANTTAFTSRATGSTKDVIIQLFEWNWDSVAAECTNFIGPAGYAFVKGESSCDLRKNYNDTNILI